MKKTKYIEDLLMQERIKTAKQIRRLLWWFTDIDWDAIHKKLKIVKKKK